MSLLIASAPHAICYTANPIAYQVHTDLDLSTAGLRITALINFWDDVDGTPGELYSTLGFPDSNGNVIFQFDKVFFDIMDEYDLPDYMQNTVSTCKNAHKKFQVTFSELTDAGAGATLTASVIHIIKGGIPFELFDSQSDIDESLTQFRTLMPDGKSVSPLQQDYLYFLSPGTFSSVTMKVTAYKTDGTVLTFSGVPISDVATYQLLCIPVGPAHLFSSDFLQLVSNYSIQLFADSTELSEVRNYFIDNSYYEESRLLIFGNSLGGCDFIFFTGFSNLTDAYTQSTANIYVPYNYQLKFGQRKTFSHLKQNKIHVSTGYKLEDEIDLIQSELLLADEKWEDAYGKFLPLIIDSTSIVKKSGRQRLFAIELDYEYSFVNKVSGTPVQPKAPVQYGSLDEYDSDPIGGELKAHTDGFSDGFD
jgi:hypothetical protein